jgi:hypothetical protein
VIPAGRLPPLELDAKCQVNTARSEVLDRRLRIDLELASVEGRE